MTFVIFLLSRIVSLQLNLHIILDSVHSLVKPVLFHLCSGLAFFVGHTRLALLSNALCVSIRTPFCFASFQFIRYVIRRSLSSRRPTTVCSIWFFITKLWFSKYISRCFGRSAFGHPICALDGQVALHLWMKRCRHEQNDLHTRNIVWTLIAGLFQLCFPPAFITRMQVKVTENAIRPANLILFVSVAHSKVTIILRIVRLYLSHCVLTFGRRVRHFKFT